MMRRTIRHRALALIALVTLIFLSTALANAQPNPDPDVIITEDNIGEVIDLRVGEVLQVELPDTPESGFVWVLLPTTTFAEADVIVGDVAGPAIDAGFLPGDEITALDSEPVVSSLDLGDALTERAGDTVAVTVLRDGEEMSIDLTVEEFEDPGIERPMVTGFIEGMPAETAGIEIGDVLLAVDDEGITSISDLQAYIGDHDGEEITVTVGRAGEELEIPVVPEPDMTDPLGTVRIGVSIQALDYSFAGLGVANLNVDSFIGVRPFNSPFPLPTDIERRYRLAQIGDPRSEPGPDDSSPGTSIWQFEAIGVGGTRLTLLHLDPTQQLEDITDDQFFEVYVEVSPAPGPAA